MLGKTIDAEKINNLRDKYKIPETVYLVKGDNRIILNLNLAEEVLILQKQCARDGFVYITEIETYTKLNGDASRAFEVVIPYKIAKPNLKLAQIIEGKQERYVKKRNNLLSEWVYLKLYTTKTKQDNYIYKEIYEVIKKLDRRGLIDKFFFIRYSDPKEHIRLRILLKDKQKDALAVINEFIADSFEKEYISDTSIALYEPEIVRYGGEAAITLSESVFEANSKIVVCILEEFQKEHYEIISVNIIKRMLETFMTSHEAVELLSNIISKTEYRIPYRKMKESLISLDGDFGSVNLSKYVADQSRALDQYLLKVRKLERDGIVTNSVRSIALSHVHMFCNRLFGTDRNKERKVMAFTRHLLYDVSKTREFKRSEANV